MSILKDYITQSIIQPISIQDNQTTQSYELSNCLVANFFKRQQSLPPSMRSNFCMISCPCSRCNPCTW